MSYDLSDLILNLSRANLEARMPKECNPGGSTICWTPTKGCGGGGPMTCVGTSTSLEAVEMEVSLPPEALKAMHEEIADVVRKHADRAAKSS